MRSSCGEGKHFFGPKAELRRRHLSVLGLQEDHKDLLVHGVGEQSLLALLGRQRQEVVLRQHQELFFRDKVVGMEFM